jgi:hypothetical protein
MDKQILSSIPGIEYYPVISLAIFFAIFAAVVIWYFRADRNQMAAIAEAALADATPLTTETGTR